LSINDNFNKVHFYLIALGCSVGIKFISGRVRHVVSTCALELGRHALCIDTHMM